MPLGKADDKENRKLSSPGNTQKCPGARKDGGFERRRTLKYVESQIHRPDAADGYFSVLPS